MRERPLTTKSFHQVVTYCALSILHYAFINQHVIIDRTSIISEAHLGKAETLLDLQGIDRVIDQLNKRLGEIQTALNESKKMKAARQAVTDTEQLAAQNRSTHAELEAENVTLAAKLDENEKRLYSGEVKVPKELIDLQNDVAMLKKQKAALDDKVLATMTKVDEADAALKDRRAELETIEAEWQARQTNLVAEQTQLNAEVSQHLQEQGKFRALLEAADLALYDQLRRRKAGLAVIELEDGACNGCGVEPTADVIRLLNRGEQIARCSNCERILVQI